MPPSVTIREHAATCLNIFSQAILLLAQTKSPNDQNGLLDEFSRFKLWMSNIGVFADLHSSLDYRLRDFSDIKDSFSRQLATIENRLRQLHDAAHQTLSKTSVKEDEEPSISTLTKSTTTVTFQDWDNAQLLQSIHQSIDWLHRLSNLVRKASFTNQHKRADRFKLKDEDDNDLSDTLTNYYSKLIKREFRGMQDALVHRLAASMLTRRRRIMYRRSQQQRWKIQQVEPKIKSLDIAAPSMKATPTVALEPTPPLQNERATGFKTAAAPSRLTATTVDASIRRHVSAPSGISKGSTAPLNEQSKLLVPPPPKGVKFGDNFVCDYCCLILPSKIALNRNAWADHVNKDLYPYVCVVDNCNDPIEIFSSRKEWLAHVRTRHLTRWYCMAKPHTQPLEFGSEDQFIEHMKIGHPGKFRDDQLSLVAENSSRPKDPVFDNCPFCTGMPDNLEEHVALHLRDLALRSLPWPDDDERYSQQGAYLQSDNSTSNENIRKTIVDFVSESEPLEFDSRVWIHTTPYDLYEPKTSAGERLRFYGHFQEVADQYQPLDLREQLSDKILARLAMKKHQADHPRLATLINNLEAPPGDKSSHTEGFADFEEILGIMQQIINAPRLDPPRRERPTTGEMAVVDETTSVSPRRNDFEIAIICTLATEYDAICLIFDNIWEEDYKPNEGDIDTYTTGRIGRHNVVLALLPHPGIFTAAAAISFYSSLKLFFLVGICGGVPTYVHNGEETDILLGDVVISKSFVECDFNGAGKFTRKDTLGLNTAHKPMRYLAASLETELNRERLLKRTVEWLVDLQAKEHARSKYRYPGTATDRLFEPDYLHKHRTVADNCGICNGKPDVICDNASHCNVCNSSPDVICDDAGELSCKEVGCNYKKLVIRKSLIDKQAIEQLDFWEAQEPVIHFGAIASSGIVVSNGLERDEISNQEGVIAFDMDGFGAWEKIPCIFIKGVSEYADGHNSERWQNFAAATAAAATKAILEIYISA